MGLMEHMDGDMLETSVRNNVFKQFCFLGTKRYFSSLVSAEKSFTSTQDSIHQHIRFLFPMLANWCGVRGIKYQDVLECDTASISVGFYSRRIPYKCSYSRTRKKKQQAREREMFTGRGTQTHRSVSLCCLVRSGRWMISRHAVTSLTLSSFTLGH